MSSTTTLCSQLGLMVDKRECSDLEFLVGPNQTPVYASRLILVARSPVFAAQFMGSFKEALTPPSSSSSSSPPGTSDATSSPLASSQQPLFWRAKLLEVEPTVFRRLLHCCYTDQLPPDDAYLPDGDSSDDSTRARDLVALYAAADRFLLDHCKQLVRDQLDKVIDCSNVLAEFDHALVVAPDLTKRDGALLLIICSNATQLLSNTDEVAEEQWLAMSTAGAAAVVESNLSGLREVDLFRAVERWYRHLEEEEEEAAAAAERDDQPAEQSQTKEERLACVLKGIQYLMMTAAELRDVVEKSGLLSDKQLLAVYRECALYRRMVLTGALPTSTTGVQLFDRLTVQDGQMAWSAQLTMHTGQYVIYVHNHPQGKTSSSASGRVSYAGIAMRLYLDRECHAATFLGDVTCALSTSHGHYICKPPQSTPKRVLVLVHVPDFAMGPASTT